MVKHIFSLCMEGRGPLQIAKALREKIRNPTAYASKEGRSTAHVENDDPYQWNTNTVVHILERREYTGCTVNFKTYSNSIWDKKPQINPAEKRLGELDRIFMRLYEDRVNGAISDERFAAMGKSYENEQAQLKQEVDTLTKEVAQQKQKAGDVERFIAQVHKCRAGKTDAVCAA